MIKQLRFDYDEVWNDQANLDEPVVPETSESPAANACEPAPDPVPSDASDHLPDGKHAPTNEQLANALVEVANLLQIQGANRFRVEAYFRAANMLLALEKPAWQMYEFGGIEALEELPAVGRTISKALQQMIRGGRWPLLERLCGNDAIETTFASVPNIGPVFAQRIHEELEIETLAELHTAAWDGRLASLEGIGDKRLKAVRESLAGRGRFQTPHRYESDNLDLTNRIPVAEILDVDDQYRFEAANRMLPRVAPRKNNPTQEAWLPILHTERGELHYTAIYSNTDRAHQMGTQHDWVVIYLENHQHTGRHGRWTVITSQFGKLKGRRIVRGREKECAVYYKDHLE